MNIGIGLHYAPIHLFSLYRARGFTEGMFPVAEQVGRRIVSLPMFNSMHRRGYRARGRRGKIGALPITPIQGKRLMKPELSVVIPVYNEEAGLAKLFERLYPALDALQHPLRNHLRQRRQPRRFRQPSWPTSSAAAPTSRG